MTANGTYTNTGALTLGVTGPGGAPSAVHLVGDGTDPSGCVLLPSPVFNLIAGSEWSISFWFRPTVAPNGYNLLGCATAGGWTQPIQVRLTSGYHLRVLFGTGDGDEGQVFLDSANPLALNTWSHIALTFKTIDGSAKPLAVYVDGVPVQVNAASQARAFSSRDGHLGARNGVASQGSCTGDYAVLGFWDRCLDYEEVLAQYSTGVVTKLYLGTPVEVLTDGSYNSWPGLTRTAGGRLIGGVSIGYRHEGGDQASFITYSDDSGATWSTPDQVSPSAGGGSRYYNGGVLALASGDVLHAYYDAAVGTLHVMSSSDDGETWGSASAVTGWDVSFAGGQSLSQSSTGRVFFTIYGWDSGETSGRYKVGVLYSDDDGATWSAPVLVGPANDVGKYNEAGIAQLADDTLVLMARSELADPGNIYRATSTDDGATWSSLAACTAGDPDTWLQRPGCPAVVYAPAYDALVCFYRGRQYGSAFKCCYRISLDGGVTWGSEHIFDADNYEYAGAVLLDAHTIGILYSTDNPAGQDVTNPGRCDLRFVAADFTLLAP